MFFFKKVFAIERFGRKTNKHSSSVVFGRVARWFVFKPKIPIWVNFGGSCYVRYWFIL
jgi:hypothetical protein